MINTIIYRCERECPIRKHCFIIKVKKPITEPIEVLYKCQAKKGEDIILSIGGEIS